MAKYKITTDNGTYIVTTEDSSSVTESDTSGWDTAANYGKSLAKGTSGLLGMAEMMNLPQQASRAVIGALGLPQAPTAGEMVEAQRQESLGEPEYQTLPGSIVGKALEYAPGIAIGGGASVLPTALGAIGGGVVDYAIPEDWKSKPYLETGAAIASGSIPAMGRAFTQRAPRLAQGAVNSLRTATRKPDLLTTPIAPSETALAASEAVNAGYQGKLLETRGAFNAASDAAGPTNIGKWPENIEALAAQKRIESGLAGTGAAPEVAGAETFIDTLAPKTYISGKPGVGTFYRDAPEVSAIRAQNMASELGAKAGAASGIESAAAGTSKEALLQTIAQDNPVAAQAITTFEDSIANLSEAMRGPAGKVASIDSKATARISNFANNATKDLKSATDIKGFITHPTNPPSKLVAAQTGIINEMLLQPPAARVAWLENGNRAEALKVWFGDAGYESIRAWATSTSPALTPKAPWLSRAAGMVGLGGRISSGAELLQSSTGRAAQASRLIQNAASGHPDAITKLNQQLQTWGDWGKALRGMLGVGGGEIANAQIQQMGADPNSILQRNLLGQQLQPVQQLPRDLKQIQGNSIFEQGLDVLKSAVNSVVGVPDAQAEEPPEAQKQTLANLAMQTQQMQQLGMPLPAIFEPPPEGYMSYANGKLNSPMDQALHMQAAQDLSVSERARIIGSLWDGGKYIPLPGQRAQESAKPENTPYVDPMQRLSLLETQIPTPESPDGWDRSADSDTSSMLEALKRAQTMHAI
jgi:hypothetical protein